MVRTRVGYAGGTTPDPSYHSLSDHTEAIQIDYDPSLVSYDELVDVFWDSHNPTAIPFSQQYQSMVFYHNQDQLSVVEEAKRQQEKERGATIHTQIVPAAEFYLAETYHQKYLLQTRLNLMHVVSSMYDNNEDFINSTLTARLNGYLGGHISLETLQSELEEMDLPAEQVYALLDALDGPGQ